LAAIVGATTPNLNGSVIIGRGTGLGANSSGSGQITGSSLPSVAINSAPSTALTNPMVSFSHSHSMANHTHDIAHTHNYPHTHSYLHDHDASHGHTSSGASATHQHSSWFANQIAPGTNAKAANSTAPGVALFPQGLAGVEHGHGPTLNASLTSSSSGGTGFGGSSAVNTFGATGTTTTSTNNDTTGSLGSVSSPSGAFSIVQPVIGVYFIIKY
jgi:hypothetical protein